MQTTRPATAGTFRRSALRPTPLFAALLALGLSTPASAVDLVWAGGSGNWSDASRWTPLGTPGAGDTATINLSSHQVLLTEDRSVGRLVFNNGYLGGRATLNAGSASFGSATLGWNYADAEGTLNVNGAATFNGAGFSTLRYGHVVNLNGDTTWSAGNGRIAVDGSYAGSSSDPAHRSSLLHIAAGTTFTDQGALAAGGSKTIGYGGGQVLNAGTYVRNGVGTTVASYGFNNTGTVQVNGGAFAITGNATLRGQSSGLINVASGATLNLGYADITAGTIANSGTVLLNSSAVTTVAAAATINGAWALSHNSAQLNLAGTHTISSLTFNDGYLGGRATLNTGSASFGSAILGWGYADAEGTLNVNGTASFNGAGFSTLRYGHVVNLNGDTTWSAGNGRIAVDGSYAGSSSDPAHRSSLLHIAAGTTFTDQGALAAGGSKTIGYGGGQVLNAGTYVRNGVGTTVANYGFNNTGTVQVNGGTFAVDQAFRNNGTLVVASNAALKGNDSVFRNDGVLTGTGTVETRNISSSLQNLGHIQPGTDGTGGTLAVTGDLLLQSAGTLDIDLVGLGQNDLITVSSDFTAGGTLALWSAGYTPVVGDSFVIATFAALSTGSQFAELQWNGGLAGNMYSVQYNADNITVHISAVPEPGTWAMMLSGALLLAGLKRRRRG